MMEDQNTEVQNEPIQEDKAYLNMDKEKAGCLGIGFSVLFPLAGVIIYFFQKKEVSNPTAYLYGALVGFLLGIFLKIITGEI